MEQKNAENYTVMTFTISTKHLTFKG